MGSKALAAPQPGSLAGVAEAVKEERLMQRGMFAAQRAWDMNHPAPGDASGETFDFNRVSAGEIEKLVAGDASGRVQR